MLSAKSGDNRAQANLKVHLKNQRDILQKRLPYQA